MIRKPLTILSLIGLLLSVGLWGASYANIGCLVGPKHFFAASAGSLQCGTRYGAVGSIVLHWRRHGERLELSAWHVHKPPTDMFWIMGYGMLEEEIRTPLPSRMPPRTISGKPITLYDVRHEPVHALRTQLRPKWWHSKSGAYWSIGIPFWIPVALCGSVLCWSRLASYYGRRKRKKLGLCLKCGYDLRASKDRCPECGSTI